jgi:succinate dehydrogenase/fumarate reductase flavoprotein subunit
VAVQCLMDDYCGLEVRFEVLFKTGLEYLRRLKQKAYSGLKAGNSHELMRCLEALDLIEIGELVMLSANERKETRGRHVRVDYPYTNLLFDNKFITIQKVGDQAHIEWRKKT